MFVIIVLDDSDGIGDVLLGCDFLSLVDYLLDSGFLVDSDLERHVVDYHEPERDR